MKSALLLRRVVLGSAPVFSVSGTVVDGDDAGIEGVLVTLSGDASDTDTTDSNGAYSFTGLVNGSYTVTPTLANLKMVPASRAANVSGENVSVDNIVGQYLLLPYTYNMTTDISETSGDLTDVADWTTHSAVAVSASIISAAADSNSYLPAGLTKAIQVSWNPTRESAINILDYEIDPSLTTLRCAVLAKASNSSRGCPSFGPWDSLVYTDAASSQSLMYMAHLGNFSPDKVTIIAQYESGTASYDANAVSLGVTITGTRYHWYRCEWNFDTNTVSYSCVRAEDSASQYSDSVAMSAAGQTLGHVPAGLATMSFIPPESSNDAQILKYWIGTASDAWPT